MKKIVTLTLSLLFVLNSWAQITITTDDFPSPWLRQRVATTEVPFSITITPGSSTSQNWNYVTQLVQQDTNTWMVMQAQDTPYDTAHADADVAVYDPIEDSYSYFANTDSGHYFHGVSNDTISFVFTRPQLMVPTNFTLNDTRMDSSNALLEFEAQNIPIQVDIQSTYIYTADAFGTIQTPGGPFDNTLRVKTEGTHHLDVFAEINGNWQLVQTADSTSLTYDWYQKGNGLRVLSVDMDVNVPNQATSATWLIENITSTGPSLTLNESMVTLAPNPASGQVAIQMDQLQLQPVLLINAQGQTMEPHYKTVDQNQYLLDIQTLTPGVWMVRMSDPQTQQFVHKKLIVN